MYKAKLLTKISIHETYLLNEHVRNVKEKNPGVLLSFEIEIDGVIIDPDTFNWNDTSLKYSTASLLNEHRIVFCCQSPIQQNLLKRYGKQATLIEISREANSLPFPLFGLFVPTNVDWQLVYLFMVQSRSTKCMKDGLKSLIEWNPYWSPKFLSIDFIKERLPIFEEIFPGTVTVFFFFFVLISKCLF